mmetsp:Transcript_10979/g.33677  ORF Transcript_10979/g.33677 Transcript_10979/m.33677 type:complete len:249 (+) Transcript_10979:2235-2981(+)
MRLADLGGSLLRAAVSEMICATSEENSLPAPPCPVELGTTTALLFLAISLKACMYSSATRSCTASFPRLFFFTADAMSSIPCPIAFDLAIIELASPIAVFIFSTFSASDPRISDLLLPSATFTSLCFSASESRICARFLLSASAWSSIALRTLSGGWMSRISYRRQRTPQGLAASLMPTTINVLRASRSSKVLSRVSLPSSDRIRVCASRDMARCGSSTPYEAATASSTFMYRTPSMLMVTLSRVIAI